MNNYSLINTIIKDLDFRLDLAHDDAQALLTVLQQTKGNVRISENEIIALFYNPDMDFKKKVEKFEDLTKLGNGESINTEKYIESNRNIFKSMPENLNKGKSIEAEVVDVKQLRKDIDDIIQRVKNLQPCRETSLVITKLQEGVMWLGMDLKRLNQPDPYPSSKDPSTGSQIESTADGLKL